MPWAVSTKSPTSLRGTRSRFQRSTIPTSSSSVSLSPAVLHQAGVDVDRAGQRDAVKRQFLFMDAIGRETGEQTSDQRDEADDETQPNHSITRE